MGIHCFLSLLHTRTHFAMVKFTSILLVTLVIASLAVVEGKRKKGKKRGGPKKKKIVEAADLIRQIRGKDVSHSDPFRWDDSYETTLLEGNKFDRVENNKNDENSNNAEKDTDNSENSDDGGWKDEEEEFKNEIPSSVSYINGQAYIKNPNYPPYLTKPGLRKKLKGKKRRNKNKNKKGNNSGKSTDMADLIGEGKRSAPARVRRKQKQTNKRMPHHLVYSQKCWNGVFEPEDGMIVDARNANEILSSPAIASNVISIPAGSRWNDFKYYDVLYQKWDDAVKAEASFVPRKPIDDMSYIQNVWNTVSEEYESEYKFMLACSNLNQCQSYYHTLKEKGLPACIYDGNYNDVLENDNTNAFFMGMDLSGNAKPGNWARSFSEDGEDYGEDGGEFDVEEGSGFMDPFYDLDLAMPDYGSGDYSTDDYWYEDIPKIHEIGKTCSRDFRLSYKAGVRKCDGWSKTSKEQCIQKCVNNELPGRCPQTDVVCKYAIWNGASNWCHVAGDCDFVESFDGIPKDRFTDNEVIEV